MAGTITWSEINVEGMDIIVADCVADADDNSYPTTNTNRDINGFVEMVVTDPGTPAPTGNYDVYLNDEDGVDILGAEGENRHASNSEQIIPKIGNHYAPRYVEGKLSLVISGNSVASAQTQVKIYVKSPRI